MCDTFIALPNYTASGNLIFGKNSDREPTEEQIIQRFPARACAETEVKCTFIAIPQVRATYEVLLSKPDQMWGAEMGVNEHGVVIGNEAVFTKIPQLKRNDGLTGMDLLRLALERCETAEAAVNCIIDLLERYGQDACGGYQDKNFFYHNSFLIGDKKEAWVLETASRNWVLKKIEKYYSISNKLTIGEEFDRISAGTIDFAKKMRWVKSGQPFNFSEAFSDRLYTKLGNGDKRQLLMNAKLGEQARKFSVGEAMQLLQTHNIDEDTFQPKQCTTASICMHATGFINKFQTTGSMVAEIREKGPSTVWLTGTSMPCLSVYKPFFFGGVSLKTQEKRASDQSSIWQRLELLHEKLCLDYIKSIQLIQAEQKELQWDFLFKEWNLIQKKINQNELNQFSEQAMAQYLTTIERWEKTTISKK